jgi:membrane-associated phospholipid phosphatase
MIGTVGKYMTKCSWKYKLTLLGVFTIGFSIFYLYPNALPLSEPMYLPLLAIDRITPFVPWTFLIYTSDYVLIFLIFILLKEKESFNSFARMVFGVLICCGLFFLFLPTTYPRPRYPEVNNLLVAGAMKFIMAADNPTNCFPSVHVALTGVSTWAIRFVGRKTHLIFWMWTLAIYASTLSTKQHYFLDILGGIFVMVIIAFLEWVLFAKKRRSQVFEQEFDNA